MTRVLLVDDQPLVREGLRRILHPDEGFEVVGECDDGAGVDDAVAHLRPDVVLMDVRMKHVDGVEATRRLREGPDADRGGSARVQPRRGRLVRRRLLDLLRDLRTAVMLLAAPEFFDVAVEVPGFEEGRGRVAA